MQQPVTGGEAYPDADPSLVLELARDRLAVQILSVDSLDGKFGVVLGWASGLALILAAILLFRHAALKDNLAQFFLTLTGGFYLLLLIVCLLGLAPRQWLASPNLDQLWREHQRLSSRQLSWRVAADFLGFWRQNEPAREAKSKRLFAAQLLFILQSLASVAAVFLVAIRS